MGFILFHHQIEAAKIWKITFSSFFRVISVVSGPISKLFNSISISDIYTVFFNHTDSLSTPRPKHAQIQGPRQRGPKSKFWRDKKLFHHFSNVFKNITFLLPKNISPSYFQHPNEGPAPLQLAAPCSWLPAAASSQLLLAHGYCQLFFLLIWPKYDVAANTPLPYTYHHPPYHAHTCLDIPSD